jgi:hypothetical protein
MLSARSDAQLTPLTAAGHHDSLSPLRGRFGFRMEPRRLAAAVLVCARAAARTSMLPAVALLAIALLSGACGHAFGAINDAGAQSRDVCVVGAGPAGVAAALSLSRRNRTVALLEREDGVGGQAYAPYTDPASGFKVNLGAIIIVPLDYPRVLAFARELNIDIEVRGTHRWRAMHFVARLRQQCCRRPELLDDY